MIIVTRDGLLALSPGEVGLRVGEREGEGCMCTTSFPQSQRRQRQVMGGMLGGGADLLGKGGKGKGRRVVNKKEESRKAGRGHETSCQQSPVSWDPAPQTRSFRFHTLLLYPLKQSESRG